jgi:hypothetical protein
MKTFFSQNRILIWLVIFLLLLNISAIIAILYHKSREVENTSLSFQPSVNREIRMSGEGRFFRDFLELDKEQFERFRIVRHHFQMKARNITEELREKKAEFLKELDRKNPDAGKIQEISNEIGQLHATLKLETGKYYLQLKTICNDEQQQKLHHFFLKIIGGGEMMPGQGRGRGMYQKMGRNSAKRFRNDSI